jgi:UDP-3-O-[3-hydroxymyristoyl] glucosamine N-acyltransferase
MTYTAQQIAGFLSGTVEGDASVEVNNVSKIEEGTPGTLTFLANPKYTPFIYTTKASIVLVNNDFQAEQPIAATLIRVENAYECLATLLKLVSSSKKARKGIDAKAVIDASAKLGENVYVGSFSIIGEGSVIGNNCQIYPQVYIGDGVTVKDNCILYPGVKIMDDCILGNNCILQSGVVIGGDGFGFAPKNNGDYQKIAQIGNVIIEDDVEIGANTTIDRATMGSTIIRKGVKLDNLIQVAHNVEIDENTVVAAQAGFAGSTKIGKNCMIGGQVGFAGHLYIADGIQIGAQSGVPSSLTDASTPYLGYPALPAKQFARCTSVFKKLPTLYPEFEILKKDVEKLKQQQKP